MKLNTERKDYLHRQLDLIRNNLRFCTGNGRDIHEVAQMQQVVECIVGLIRKDSDGEFIESHTKRLYDRHLAYFKKKYRHVGHST